MHILELNRKIRKGCKDQEYHMRHISLAKDYAMFIRKRIDINSASLRCLMMY